MEELFRSLIDWLCRLVALVWEGGCFVNYPGVVTALLERVTL